VLLYTVAGHHEGDGDWRCRGHRAATLAAHQDAEPSRFVAVSLRRQLDPSTACFSVRTLGHAHVHVAMCGDNVDNRQWFWLVKCITTHRPPLLTSYNLMSHGSPPTSSWLMAHLLQAHGSWLTSYKLMAHGSPPTSSWLMAHLLQAHISWLTSYKLMAHGSPSHTALLFKIWVVTPIHPCWPWPPA
jgi:hypothetical protein